MPKNLLQDMVKVKRSRTIKPRVVESPPEVIPTKPRALPENYTEEVFTPERKSFGSRYGLWFVVVICLFFLFLALSQFFLKATVTVTPKTHDAVLNEDLSASKDSSSDSLAFNLVVIPGVETKTIQAASEKDVSTKATGTVIIYNAFSLTPQPLLIDTRLEGSNGKLYKTVKPVVVPGMKGSTPGSVEVGIYGTEAGADYNSGPLDFKIFGFKGTPKYTKFYARSKGDITGGFVGKAPAVSDTDLARAEADLKNALTAKLLQKATDQIPSGFILFKNAIFLNTDNANSEPNISSVFNADGSETLTMQGTLDGILLDEQKLTKKIVTDTISSYDGSDVYISNIKDLNFTLSNKDNTSLENSTQINFNLSGPAKIVWKVDEAKLTTDLLGKSKKDFNGVLAQYPNIDSADLVVSPFWKSALPDKAKDIKVIVNYPK